MARLTARVSSAFGERNYRLFWTGQVISVTGTWIQTVSLAWLVLQLTDSPLALGLVSVAQFTPVLLFSMFAGVFADRLPKRRVLLVTQSWMMLLAFMLWGLAASGRIHVAHVYAIAVLLGVGNAFDMPSRQAFVVEMVGREKLVTAVALNSSIFNAARVVGPAVAGLIIAWQGVTFSFLLNGFSFLAVITALAMIREQELHRMERGRRRTVLAELREGFGYVARSPRVRLVIALIAGLATFGMNFNVLLPVFARDVLDVGPVGFGFMSAALGTGSLLAALSLASIGRTSPRVLVAGGLGLAVAETAIALSRWYPLTLLLLPAAGASMVTVNASANTTVQMEAPDALRGRVVSLYMTVNIGTAPLGGFVMGFLANAWGAPIALASGAGLCFVAVATAGVALLRQPAVGHPPLPPGELPGHV